MIFSNSYCPKSPISGHIFGLEINTARATLYSVNVVSKELVHIYKKSSLEFTSFDENTGKSTFHFDSFWKMVLLIGHVPQGVQQVVESAT